MRKTPESHRKIFKSIMIRTILPLIILSISSCAYRLEQSSEGMYREMKRKDLAAVMKSRPDVRSLVSRLGFPTDSVRVWSMQGLLERRLYYDRIVFETGKQDDASMMSLRPEPFTVFFDDQDRYLSFSWGDCRVQLPFQRKMN